MYRIDFNGFKNHINDASGRLEKDKIKQKSVISEEEKFV